MKSLLLITSLLGSSAQVSGFASSNLAFKLAANTDANRNYQWQRKRQAKMGVSAPLPAATSSVDADDEDNVSRLEKRLLDDFRIAGGEVVHPYRVLNVSRNADRQEIKAAYRTLSRKYHPDGILQRNDNILPGRCNNMDDVREEWERIKLSYEILTDKKLRVRYDRNSALADPAAAVGRAALGTIGWGLSGVGKGLIEVGKMALNQKKT
uniref:J domain-containing protein n=1 Tax=Minutocellus polymorphus TaxID=265543 RepID=A0A7S0FJN7_9STRA|mmetsp:Transcript_13887/g.23111  ORF Transcript_13887/g.23111 Transcript_13887/m.23111 type:complete len:209 (+) Transcript_13887:106-732(+)